MVPQTLEAPPRIPGPPVDVGRFPGGGGDGAYPIRQGAAPASTAVWLLVASVTILFAAFTSTYLARRAEADWIVGPLPRALYVSTMLLLVSSAALEWARRQGARGRLEALRAGLLIATVLGLGFLAAQIAAWRQLAALGIFLSTNPHSAFFYLFTGAHALHVTGGILGLIYALARAQTASTAEAAQRAADPATTFWHFLDGLWVYLFLILFVL
jgi:cytochrome c oxidase subunit 3